MMRKTLAIVILLIIPFSGIIIYKFSIFGKTRDDSNYDESFSFMKRISEVSSNLFLAHDGSIYFSNNEYEGPYLYKFNYKDDAIPLRVAKREGLAGTFLYENKVALTYDKMGNQKYQVECKEISDQGQILFKDKLFNMVFSSSSGRWIIFQTTNNQNSYSPLHLLDSHTRKVHQLSKTPNKFNGFSFSKNEEQLVFSVDNSLFICDLKTVSTKEIIPDFNGEKLNPYIHSNTLYFVNNFNSNFYSVFSVDLNNYDSTVKQVYSTNADIRSPKSDGKNLYFIKIINSKYLLVSQNLTSKKTQYLTTKGVVYDYQVLNDKVLMSYSDLKTPRSLICLSLNKSGQVSTYRNLTNKYIHDAIDCRLIIKNDLSRSYRFSSLKIKNYKGVILFIHGGGGDISPRWDNMIYMLCELGYVVFAPNFPTSLGYGLRYSSASPQDAVLDLSNWSDELVQNYPKLPIFYLANSYGSVLMDNIPAVKRKRIAASASLFGIPNANIQNDIPTQYFLGKHDPLVDCNDRVRVLLSNGVSDEDIAVFENEGHTTKKYLNLIKMVIQIDQFFDKNI